MPRVLAFDLGKNTGFGFLDGHPKGVRSGSLSIVDRWSPLGKSLLTLEERLHKIIAQYKPDLLACAKPFVREVKKAEGVGLIDTPQNLVPMFSCFAVLNMLAAATGIPLKTLEEQAARSLMLGEFMPMGSKRVKAAVMQACRDRGWPVADHNAADALCMASAIFEKASPAQGYELTPLFQAMPLMAQRRKPVRKKAA